MFIQSWSKSVRNWISKGNRAKSMDRKAIRRRLPAANSVRLEELEGRQMLSALSISDVTIVEGDAGVTNAVFTVTLDAPDVVAVTVIASTADDTATSPLDYVGLPATLITFAPGETTQTITVPINGDTIDEGDETFFVNLTTPVNATIADAQGVGTITDDDVAPTLLIDDVTLVEGNAGTTNAVFTITLSAASGQAVTVIATSADDTATSPLDYLPLVPTTVIFAPGETTKTVTVAVNGDTVDEADETFFVNLTGPINATIADAQGVGTITDDEVAPTLSIDDVTIVEGDAGTTNAVFTVTLSGASDQTITVLATSANGSATTPLDYLALVPTTLIFAPGETTKTVTVAINGDLVDEVDETFFVNLTGPINATITDDQGLGTITDDDDAPTISIDDVTIVEGDAGTTNAVFTVTLSEASEQVVNVVATSADGTATTPLDYLALVPTTLIFAPGETTKTVTVAINGDLVDEADETFFVNLTAPINATITDDQGLGTITDDEVAPTISINDVTIVEGDAGTTNAVFTVTLSAASGQAVTVIATSADDTATTPLDYLALIPTTLIFAPGETTKTVTVAINGDLVDEVDETFFVNLTGPINATVSDAQGVGTITDDDDAPTISINDVTVIEGNAGTTNAVFTVTLSAASSQIVTVLATPADGTALSPLDYVGLPMTVTFAPGETTKTVTVAVNGDTVDEADETFFVNLSAPINATINDAQGLGTITDDDAAPSISIDDVTIVEGDAGTTNAVFTVTLSSSSDQAVTVIATSANGTATTPLDYLALVPTTLIFAPGETTKTVTVAINGDLVDEADETFFVNLTAPINATITDAEGLGTITDDDLSPTISINDVTIIEGDAGTTNAVFTVTLSAASGQAVTVVATSADGSATTPLDYLALVPTTLIFAPGETTKTVTVAVNGDTVDEVDETFFVNLTAPLNATITDAQGTGTITDEDEAPTVSIGDVTLTEGDAGTTNAVFTVTLSEASGQTVTVVATSADGTATTPADYLALLPTILTFAPGETTKTVTVAVNGDTLAESNETFFINLTAPVNATVSDAQGQGTITDNDALTITSASSVSVPENTLITTVILDVDATTGPDQIPTYSLSGIDAAQFTINPLTGEIRFANSPNFEAPADVGGNNVYNITVTATADLLSPRTTSQNVTITVTPVNDISPVFTNASPTFSIPENATNGTVVSSVSATDGDLPSDTLTYSIINGNENGAFAINPATGQITVADSNQLDFETLPLVTLQVRVTDNGSPTPLTADAVVVITLTDSVEGPLITILDAQGTYQIGQPPVFVAPGSTFTYVDVASPDYSNAKLTVSIVAGRSRGDKLNVLKKGDGSNPIYTKGHKVFSGDQQIGILTRGRGNRQPNLVVDLNNNATSQDVDNLLERVNFRARSGAGTTRTINLQVTNVSGTDSNVATRDIAVLPR